MRVWDRWRTKETPLWCRVFGHKVTGYGDALPYVRRNGWGNADNMGVWHNYLSARCGGCGQWVTVAKIHERASAKEQDFKRG